VADSSSAKVVAFPDLAPKTRRQILSGELGTQFDAFGDRLFAYFDGSVLDVGEFTARDLSVMLQKDGQAAAIEAVLTLPIRQASRAIEKGANDNGEADFVRSVLMAPATAGGMKTPLQDVIGQLTSAQTYKKAFYEKIFRVRDETDGKIVYDKLAYRPPATCELKLDPRNGDPDGFRQQVWYIGGQMGTLPSRNAKAPGWVDIPRVKSFVYVHGKHRAPLTGTGELDLCYACYKTKLKLLFLWYQFLESQSLPKVVVYGNSPRDAASRADDVASMRSSGVVGWEREQDPAAKTFDIISSDGKGASQFNDALSFLETWQTSSVLAGFMGLSSLASLGRGSLALSQDQSAFFLKSRQAVTAEMQEALTHDVIAPLVTLNFGPGASYPSFQFGALTDESGQALVALFQAMAVAPSLQVPTGILDIITERLANFLNLDINAVDKIITEGAQQRAAQAQATAPPGVPPKVAAGIGALAGGVNAATNVYKKAVAQSTQAPLPEDIDQPFSVPNLGSGTQAG
jgi:hypothetical protein